MKFSLKLDSNLTLKRPFYLLDRYFVSPTTYVLRFQRNGIPFHAGQFLVVGELGKPQRRKYSIYSSEQDDFFEILVKVVENGAVSNELKQVFIGEKLTVLGPKGKFGPKKQDIPMRKYLFISTGTGISPFRSIINSNHGIEYTLLHGIRTIDEAYGREYIPEDRYITCISREKGGAYHGRVTEYLQMIPVEEYQEFYLCGNRDMIEGVKQILQDRGVSEERIFTEVYF